MKISCSQSVVYLKKTKQAFISRFDIICVNVVVFFSRTPVIWWDECDNSYLKLYTFVLLNNNNKKIYSLNLVSKQWCVVSLIAFEFDLYVTINFRCRHLSNRLYLCVCPVQPATWESLLKEKKPHHLIHCVEWKCIWLIGISDFQYRFDNSKPLITDKNIGWEFELV